MDAEARVRVLVQEERGQLDDDSWDWLVGVHFGNTEPVWDVTTPAVVAEEIIETLAVATQKLGRITEAGRASHGAPRPEVVDARAARTHAAFPHPPEWWNRQSREVMKSYRVLQRLVWGQLGMEGPLSLADAESFLSGTRRLERQQGRRETLVYPDPASSKGLILRKEMNVRSGWTTAELKEAGFGQRWFGERMQPLAHLSRSVTSLAQRTGCSEEEVCAFLLCDVPLRLPWVTYDYVGFGPPATIAPAIVLTIGTPDVPAEDVRRAYLSARDVLRSVRSQFGDKNDRRFRATTLELVGFVEERRPEMAWDDIHGDWTSTHPKGSKGYHSTMNSMRSAYYRAPMRRKKVGP